MLYAGHFRLIRTGGHRFNENLTLSSARIAVVGIFPRARNGLDDKAHKIEQQAFLVILHVAVKDNSPLAVSDGALDYGESTFEERSDENRM